MLMLGPHPWRFCLNWSGVPPGHQDFCRLPVEFQRAVRVEDCWVRRWGSETSKPGPMMEEAECNRPRGQADQGLNSGYTIAPLPSSVTLSGVC